MGNEMKTVLSVLVDILLSFVLLIFLCLMILRFAGIQSYVVMSGSMEPSIETGSLCFVNTKYLYHDIQEGDVIAFEKTGNMLVTHRVKEIAADGFITQGDNNDVADESKVTVQNYRGKTITAIPKAGYIVWYLSTIQGKFTVLILFLLLFLITLICKVNRHEIGRNQKVPPFC